MLTALSRRIGECWVRKLWLLIVRNVGVTRLATLRGGDRPWMIGALIYEGVKLQIGERLVCFNFLCIFTTRIIASKKKFCSHLPLFNSAPPPKDYSQDEKNIDEAYSPLAPPSYAFAKKHMHTMCGQNAKVLSICQTWLYSTYTKPLCFKDLNGFLNYGRNLLAL